MWPKSSTSRSSLQLYAALFLLTLLRRPFPARAGCRLYAVANSYVAQVVESKQVGSNLESPDLQCEGFEAKRSTDYRLAIEPDAQTPPEACAQFRPVIEAFETSNSLLANIKVAHSLDYERPETRLCVGQLALYSALNNSALGRQSLRIQVLDVNDNAPRFVQQTFAFAATENEPPPTDFALPVRDGDSAPNAQFNASFENVSCSRATRLNLLNASYCRARLEQHFRLDVHTAHDSSASSSNAAAPDDSAVAPRSRVALVATGRPFDHEDVSAWRFVVRVSDEKASAKKRSDEATVTIDVRDRPEPPAVSRYDKHRAARCTRCNYACVSLVIYAMCADANGRHLLLLNDYCIMQIAPPV